MWSRVWQRGPGIGTQQILSRAGVTTEVDLGYMQ